MKTFISATILAISFLVLTASKPEKGYYNEIYRPQFHFSPEKNWMNDPNGLVYYDGEYHLFYQHNPNGNEWGYMHWGHAVSRDLVHWTHLPKAIYPDNQSEEKEFCTAFSGSAIVDHHNVLGLQKGDDKTLVAFYTSYQCGQRISYSTDRGRTWYKYAGNPIIPYQENDDARDPKVFWYQPGQHWVMVLYRRPDTDDRKKGVSFYTSQNLTDWEFTGHIPGFYECPDLVELRVNNRPDDTRWVLFDGDGSYLIGSFDGKKFTPESIKMKSDFGRNYYATQTWSNLPESDGRTLQIAWMKGGEWPNMPFNGQMTFPSELSLKKFNNGIFLIRQPAREIELLHEKGEVWKDKNLIPGLNENLIKKVSGDCLHIKGRFDLKNCDAFGFMFRTGKKSNGTELLYSVKRQTLSVLGETVPVEPIDNKIYLEILIDRASIEVYINNGRINLSNCFFPDEGSLGYQLFNTGGELLVEELEIYPLKSVWRSGK